MTRGRKCTWLAGKTDTVRVPIAALTHVLALCRVMDGADVAEYQANWNRLHKQAEIWFQKTQKPPTAAARKFMQKQVKPKRK